MPAESEDSEDLRVLIVPAEQMQIGNADAITKHPDGGHGKENQGRNPPYLHWNLYFFPSVKNREIICRATSTACT